VIVIFVWRWVLWLCSVLFSRKVSVGGGRIHIVFCWLIPFSVVSRVACGSVFCNCVCRFCFHMLGRTLFSGRPDGIDITAAGYND